MRVSLRKFLLVILLISPWLAMAQQPATVTDGVNGTVAAKAARTSPALADVAHVVSISPNDTGLPVNAAVIVNKATANVGGATVKTLTDTITATKAGNSLVVDVCAGSVANGGTIVLTLTETGGSDTWTLAATQAVSTTFACSIYYATNITAGVTAVIATFSGASSANTTIAMEAYEVSGLIALTPSALDATATGTATGTAPTAGPMFPSTSNEYAFAAFGVGTAAQTVTLGGTGTWANDSGQVNPTSASGLFSFVGASQFLSIATPLMAAGTITSEPWVLAAAVFKPVMLSVPGGSQITCNGIGLINQASTTAATVITGVAGKITYICGINLVAATANNVAMVEGTTGTCGTGTLGLFGGATAATGWNLAANGGLAYGNGLGLIGKTTVAGNNVCILPSGAGQVSGSISYVQF